MPDTVVDDAFVDDFTLIASDGYRLAASLFLPRGPRLTAVLLNSAAAVPRKFYRSFAAYLASRGCAVVTYDYRGTGGSRPKSLVGFKANMSDWATLDIASAVAWMRERYKDMPLKVIGHSFGGQAIGLIPNNVEISRTLFVAAQAGYWKLMASPERYRIFAMMNYVGVPMTKMLGYVPGRFGLGEDMPKQVFLQWTSWVMNERYFFTDPNLSGLSNFQNYKGGLRALCISDDPWVTRPAVDMLCSGFTSITPDVITVLPGDHGAGQIGHFGFFRPQHRETLWRTSAEWLQETMEG